MINLIKVFILNMFFKEIIEENRVLKHDLEAIRISYKEQTKIIFAKKLSFDGNDKVVYGFVKDGDLQYVVYE